MTALLVSLFTFTLLSFSYTATGAVLEEDKSGVLSRFGVGVCLE